MGKVVNMFREFSMKHVDGYKKLQNWQKDLFDTTYKKHLSSVPLAKRVHYLESQIKKVEKEDNLLKIYFNNGVCYLYLQDYKWLKVPEAALFG